jgi:signal transduction histidine kinase
MESRAATIGGRLEVTSAGNGDGTTVVLAVPLNPSGGAM